jgi:hypothetical protein
MLVRLGRTGPQWAGTVALMATTADLAVANARYVVTVPQAVLDSKPEVLQVIEERERRSTSTGPYRIYRMPAWEPRVWQTTRSSDRAADFVAWERDTLMPGHGINFGVEYTHAFGVGGLSDYEWFFRDFPVTLSTPEAARSLGAGVGQVVIYYPRRSFDMWNTRYFVVPCDPHDWHDEYRSYASFVFHSESIYPQQGVLRGSKGPAAARSWMDNRDVQVWRNLSEFPRAWVVHDARWINPTSGPSRGARDAALQEILYADDPLWHDATRRAVDPRTLAWIDNGNWTELAPYLSGQSPGPAETVKASYPTPQRAELEATLESPGLVILADVDYPGWELTIDGQTAPIYRVNLMMRGAAVPAGTHHLVYTYSPRSFRVGWVLSILGLGVLALLCAGCALRPVDRMVENR